MAVPVLSPSSYGRLKSRINQYRASTGRDMSPGMIQSLLEAEISQQAGRATEEAKLALNEKQVAQSQKIQLEDLELQRAQQSATARAARTSGLVQLGETALTAATMLGKTEFGKQAISKAGSAIGMGSTQTAATTGSTSVGFSPALTSEYGALETSGTSGVTSGSQVAATTGGSVAGGIAGGVATAVPYYGFAKAGGGLLRSQYGDETVAGQVGGSLSRPLNVEQFWTEELFPNAPGAVKVVEDALNPLAPLERIFSDVVGTVICTELNRQGLLDTKVLKLAGLYRTRFLDAQTYNGYMRWAPTVVCWMKQSKLVTSLMRPIAVCWCLEAAHRLVPSRYKSSLFGKLVDVVIIPVCRFLGRNT